MTIDVIERLNAALSDRYTIERELGEGGMATVYLAEDVRHDRNVALKVLKPELAAVVGAERFLAEIKTTAQLQHPHILPLHDSGEADGFLFFVMPYIEGESLRDRLEREQQLPVEEALGIAEKVAAALQYAHEQGVVHRDIKPANILLSRGEPMVADFGIALAVSQAGGGRITETGLSLGTPHYMSPEQATADRDPDARSDLYSLGAVLYEMLAGEPPHTAPTAQAVVARILSEEPRPVGELRRTAPRHVGAAVARALQKLPADRFESVDAFAEALEDPTFSFGGESAGPVTASRGARLRERAFLPLAVALLLALGLAGWAWLGPVGTVVDGASWATEVPLSDGAALSSFASIAPDGSFVVYGGGSANGLELWIRRAASPEPAPLPGGEGGYMPAVSPDGRQVAFQVGWRIRVMPVEGGTSTLIAPTNGLWDRLTWTDADHLVFRRRSGLVRFPVAGGDPVPLTRVDSAAGETSHVAPSALPDDGGVVFTVVGEDFSDLDARRIAVVGPDGGPHAFVMPGVQAIYAEPGHLIVLRADGALVAVPYDVDDRTVTGEPVPLGLDVGRVERFAGYPSVSEDGRLVYTAAGPPLRGELVRARPSGEISSADSSWGYGIIRDVEASRDGSRVAVAMDVSGSSQRLWLSTVTVRDLSSGAVSRLDVPDPGASHPAFAPDGSLVYSVPGAIYRTTPGAASPPERRVTTEGGWPSDLAVSPDGSTLYYVLDGDVIAHRLDEPASTGGRPLLATPATETAPSPSPDGEWLAYVSDESGRTELYVRPTDPVLRERWQVSRGGARGTARWSPDGEELYYITDRSTQEYYGLTADSLMAVRMNAGATLSVGERRALFSTQYYSAFSVLPDGNFLIVRNPGWAGGNLLMMVDDWKALGGSR